MAMAKKGKNAIKALSGVSALGVFGSKRKEIVHVVKNAADEEAALKLRSLSIKETNECDLFVGRIKPDSAFAGCGEFMCYLTKMLLNADGSQMWESIEEGLIHLQGADQSILSQLLPVVRDFAFVSGRALKEDETPAEALERAVEEEVKNSETAPAVIS